MTLGTVRRCRSAVRSGDFARRIERDRGLATPAVLRPATGRIWVFADWPANGAPAAGRPLATVPGALTARVRAVGRCDRLEVVDARGQSTAVG